LGFPLSLTATSCGKGVHECTEVLAEAVAEAVGIGLINKPKCAAVANNEVCFFFDEVHTMEPFCVVMCFSVRCLNG